MRQMAFAMGKEMVCPLCRYLHKDQPFMSLESADDAKPSSSLWGGTSHFGPSYQQQQHQHQQPQQRSVGGSGEQHMINSIPLTQHEHPTSGTVLSMMPSLFETTLGRGPSAGTIQTSPDGICLRTSTWLMLYAMPFTVALCFLGFILGKVETMWSKISCLIGAAICYMVCWALVVAVMDPDHEARAIVMQRRMQEEQEQQERLRQLILRRQQHQLSQPLDGNHHQQQQLHNGTRNSNNSNNNNNNSNNVYSNNDRNVNDDQLENEREAAPMAAAAWTRGWFVRSLQARVVDLAEMLDNLPDMMAEW
ncbi:hypothetical protein BGZ83_008389 [Gryganskiella cystojenkinii]|nr:hypothetical protein BGZ83_008389 [Gryganskiella cystojenkinii]